MTDGQYRTLVAYLNFWTPMYPRMDLDAAIKDIGITDSRDDVIAQLARAGHDWNDETGRLGELE